MQKDMKKQYDYQSILNQKYGKAAFFKLSISFNGNIPCSVFIENYIFWKKTLMDTWRSWFTSVQVHAKYSFW